MTNKQKKQNAASGGLYIALAICILSVICIGVYSAIIHIFDPSSLEPVVDSGEKKPPSIVVETPKNDSDTSVGTPLSPDISVGKEPEEELPDQNVNTQPVTPSYTLPVAGSVSKAFSNDILVYSETMNDYRVHNGVDLSATLGTPVKAFTDGIVLEIYNDPLMGCTLILDHGNETCSIYQNLSTQLPEGIAVGAQVKEGQVIAGVGETVLVEIAQEPHLHFEVTVNGKHVDPMSYFQ